MYESTIVMNQNHDQLHILVISNSYPTNYQPQTGIFWKRQAEKLAMMGNQVGVLAVTPISMKTIMKKWKRGEKNHPKNLGILAYTFHYPNIPGFNFLESYIARWKGKSLFHQYLKAHGKPDVIHLHRYEGGLLALYLQKRYHIPVVLTEHSSRFLYQQLTKKEVEIARNVFTSVDYRIAVSPALSQQLEKDFGLSFHYLPNSVDIEQFHLDEHSIKEEKFTFLSAGQLGENKNQSMLLDAFERFQNEIPDAQLILAGEGPLSDFLIKKIKDKGLDGKVKLVGQLSPSELINWYHKSHVFVVSSIKETFSVVIIEAMSCGLPVISTKCGGPESILTQDTLGELTEISADALFQAMKKVFAQYATYSPREITKFVHDHYAEEVVLKKQMDIYQHLC